MGLCSGSKEDEVKDTKALSHIVEGVSKIIFNDIRELISGKDAWDKLAETYDNKGMTRKVSIIKVLVNTCYIDHKDKTEYLHKEILANPQLKSTGTKPDEELVAGIILANLPDRFDPLIMALKNCGETITVDYVRAHLMAGDIKPVDDGKEQAFLNEHVKDRKYVKGKYFKCNLFGHKSSDCNKSPCQKGGTVNE